WPTLVSGLIPDDERLAALRRQLHELDLAEAKLDVGLSIEVRGAPSAEVSIDGAKAETKVSPFIIEAKASVGLELGANIAISVRGGQTAHRELAQKLRREWQAATTKLFAALGVTDFGELEAACRVERESHARADAFVRDAQTADHQRAALGDPQADQQRIAMRIAELEARLN